MDAPPPQAVHSLTVMPGSSKNVPRPDVGETTVLPVVFGYLDHRVFLRDWFEAKRRLVRTFSYRVFARKAGFASHAFLSEVIQGRRNLSEESVDKCLSALGLAGEAAEYFRLLVRYSQETHLERRSDLLSDLLRRQASREVERVGRGQSAYFSSWHLPVLREVAVLWGPTPDPEAMAAFFHPPLSVEEVRSGLVLLEELGLLRREEDGRWSWSCPRLTPGDIDPETVRNLKRQMLGLAMERLSAPESPDTHVSSLTISVSRGRLARIREILDRTRRELLAETATDSEPADQVLQIGFQMVPATASLERYRSRHG